MNSHARFGWPLMHAVLGFLMLSASAPAQNRPAAGELLGDGASWRFHISWRLPATLRDGKIDLGAGHGLGTINTRWVKNDYAQPTPPPPDDWRAADFDDAAWPRRTGLLFGGYGYGNFASEIALLCMRGRFALADPARAKGIKLELTYRGGVVVYLNGAEIARGHLPAGKIELTTLAEGYAKDAFYGPDGTLLGAPTGRTETPPKELVGQYDQRLRKVTVELPADLLRSGVNVLAMELHRTTVPAALVAAGTGKAWGTCGLVSASLTAPADSGASTGNITPAGVTVWNCDALARAGTDLETGDPLESLRPIRLSAPRNGVSSGQVALSGAAEFKGPEASVSALRSEKGDTIPLACVEVRHVAVGEKFPMLYDKPAAAAKVHAVWVTARPPKETPAGVYRGSLTLAGPDRPSNVPVELTVHDWICPDPRDLTTSVSLLHCPESVAGFYKVRPWSDEHFKLLEKSLALLGYAGNSLASVSAIGQDLFGDCPAIVFRKDKDGYTPEFGFARRYLEIYNKVAGPPRQLSVQVWNYNVSRRGVGRDGGSEKWIAKTIKCWFIEGDKLVPGEMPVYSQPGTERTWAAVVGGIRQIMKDLGWTRTRLLLGTGGDCLPNDEIVAFFKQIDPTVYWRVATHGGSVARWGQTPEQRTQGNGLIVGYANMVRRNVSRKELVPDCPFDSIKRDGLSAAPMDYFTLAALARISARYSGFGFVPFDFWSFTTPEGTTRSPLASYAGFGNITPHCSRFVVAPGPHGAVATPQLEAIREGMQVTEAAVYLKSLIENPSSAATLGPDFAADVSHTIQSMVDVMESNRRVHPAGAADVRRWIDRVYSLAARAAKANAK